MDRNLTRVYLKDESIADFINFEVTYDSG